MLGWLFPIKCVFCGAALPAYANLGVCGACEKDIPFYRSSYLFEASGSDEGTATGSGVSAAKDTGVGVATSPGVGANGWRNRCDRVVCALRYEGFVSSALMRYKFYQQPGIGETLAALLCAKIDRVERASLFDCVACVPLSSPREKERGYNQAAIIARHTAKYFGRPFDGRLLLRDASALRQSRLSGRERSTSARAAYSPNPKRAAAVEGMRVLLVDDIATTLATINACAGALKAAGASSVVGAVVAARV